MKLTVTISDPGQAKARAASRTLEKGSLTIGRGASADWVIDDPERLLSKLHCRIENRSGRFILTDTSTNGVFVNGAGLPLGDGRTAVLNDGDRLMLGGVSVAVAIDMDAGTGRANQILPDDYSFLEMLGKAYAKAAPSDDFPAADDAEPWNGTSTGDTVPFQHQAFRPPPIQASRSASTAAAIPDDWRADAGPAPINGGHAAARPAALPPDTVPGGGSPRGNVERQYRALVTGLASYAAGNAALRAALGCSVGFTNPNRLLQATDAKTLQAALSSGDGSAITEVLAAGLAHQSALAAAMRAALERLSGSAALDFKTALASTYRQVFEAETRRIAAPKE